MTSWPRKVTICGIALVFCISRAKFGK